MIPIHKLNVVENSKGIISNRLIGLNRLVNDATHKPIPSASVPTSGYTFI